MAFKVGQKVVCVNDAEDAFKLLPIKYVGDLGGLKKGEIYTICDLEPDTRHKVTRVVVSEISRGCGDDHLYGFHPDRFRPLVSTNIDVFKAILANPHKQLETVE